MNQLISVIIPIYKVEEVLPRCIRSVCNQTYRSLEIILVDDGSPDNSGKLCDEFAKKDNRIKVIHKRNGGLSDARNAGLLVAEGDYIAFLDGDDFIIDNAFEVLMEQATKYDVDVLVANALRIYENGKKVEDLMREKVFQQEVMTGLEYFTQSLDQGSMSFCAWISFCKRKFLIDNSLYFKKGILHEDNEWTPRILLKAGRVRYINFKFYNYIIREGSITTSKDMTQNGIDIINTCYDLEKIYISIQNKKTKMKLMDNLLDLYLAAIYLGKLNRPEYRKILKKSFIFGKVNSMRTFLKSVLFLINMQLYFTVNELSKRYVRRIKWHD